jgi:hypothetical protein
VSSDATLAVSAAVVALVELVKWARLVNRRWAPLAVFVASALGVAVWMLSQASVPERTWSFGILSAWINVAVAAAGVYGLARHGAEGVSAARVPRRRARPAKPKEKRVGGR